jgi:RHS repeat-associated protein
MKHTFVMKKIIYLIFLLPFVFLAQTTTENYIKTTTYKVETTVPIGNPTASQAVVQINYFDGLGRPKQQIALKQSGNGKDIITHIAYDALGRQTKEYLPYTDGTTSLDYRTNALTDLLSFYLSEDPTVTGNPYFETTTNPYAETFFEPSPLNRTRKTAAPGDIWKGNETNNNDKSIKFDYTTNTNNVKRFTVTTDLNSNGIFYPTLVQDNGNYQPNQLYVTITKDENWTAGTTFNTTHEFKDKLGRVVLKRTFGESNTRETAPDLVHDTYYVYDEYNNLTFVLPPLVNTNLPITNDVLNGLCYQHKYDHRNRLVEKKLPGKQWEYIVYDQLDRPVATGPANSPFANLTNPGWLITKYDALNRPIITGFMIENNPFTSTVRKNLQVLYNNQTTHSETKIHTSSNTTINNVSFRYTSTSYPTDGYHVLTVNYFDDYNFPNAPTLPTEVEGQQIFYNNTLKPKGLPTANWVRVVSSSLITTQYELTYLLYDKYANPIKTYTSNHITGFTETDSNFDFSGKVLYTITRHKKTNNDPPLEIKDVFGYTPQDRLRQQNQQINQGEFQQLYKNTYDYLGQLIKKEVGNDKFNHGTVPIPLQVVDYRYNIRGWLTHINNTKGLQNTGDPDDLFSFAIHYTNTDQDYQNQVAPLYNGNIAETLWRSGSDNVERSYGYKYDALNRLTNAIYGKPGNSVKLTHNYNEWLTYDKNGNILTLDRNGISDSYWDLIKIDQLSYEYANNNSNLLVKVTDDTQNDAGFKKGNPTSDNDFTYDDNGNLITDKNKNITQIIYNHLNLPTKITFNGNANQYISYLYNATGEKIQKTIKNQDSLSTTHYINGFQYFDHVLQFFPTPEGYVKNTPTESGGYSFDYVYNYTDHLGNIRLSYTQDPQTGALAILEEQHYYPFGLQHKNYNSDITKIDLLPEQNNEKGLKEAAPPSVPLQNPGYMYKFQGQELEVEFGKNTYAYQWRDYDPAIGRFNKIDRFAEKYYSVTPYHFSANNPVFFMEINGDSIQGVSRKSARRTRREIRQSFKDNKKLAKLFKTKGEKFKGISQQDFDDATQIQVLTKKLLLKVILMQ